MTDKEKQIEEMAKILCNWSYSCRDCYNKMICPELAIAEALYNAGYRKVEERNEE